MSDTDKDITSAFKEKTWGKEEDGGYTTDGYSFRGKRAFGEVLNHLKDMMKKGVNGKVNDIVFKVLDNRKKGAELNIESEITENDNRCIAVLKLYGPSKKKEFVAMVTKSKQSDSKFVTILAKLVIEPLIKKFFSNGTEGEGEKPPVKQSVSVRGKEIKLLKCPNCEKTSYSLPGLKGHITKMHNQEVYKKPLEGNKRKKVQENQEDHILKEANKVVNLLLDDVIEIIDEKEESIDDVEEFTLDETIVDAEIQEKEYLNKCENCSYVVNATKRYIALQQLRKHKESCCKNKINDSGCLKSSKCDVCDFEDKNSISMRRHMRDQHDIITGSTSPPPKRKRRV